MEGERGETEGRAPGWLTGGKAAVDLDLVQHQGLKKWVEKADRRPQNMLSHERLIGLYDEVDGMEDAPEPERDLVLGAITAYDEERFPSETPEIKGPEKITPPETDELIVREVFDRVFALVDRGITEKKDFDAQFNEYPAVQRLVKDLGEGRGPRLDELGLDDETKARNEKLGKYLAHKYPQGIYLKERLEIFMESMRRLQKRYLEVVDADGSLAGLKVQEVSKGFAQNIRTQLTVLEPLDWYVLTHLDDLFPEGTSPDRKEDQKYRINIEEAWEAWQGVGKKPFKEENGRWKPKEIKVNGVSLGHTLEDFYTSEAVAREVRTAISDLVGVGLRAEQLAHMFLTVSLTYDMWDRGRWEIQTVGEARDLMIPDWKRISRLKRERTGEGIPYSVGLFWAEKDQDLVFTGWVSKTELETEEDKKKPVAEVENEAEATVKKENPELWKVLRRIKDILARNKKRALFLNSEEFETQGTLIGDYWHSAKFKGAGGIEHKLSEFPTPRDIPWLDMQGIEAKTYASYFEYSLALAAALRELIMKREYKPEELVDPAFWRSVTDLTHRLGDYCPWVIARNSEQGRQLDKKEREILKRRIINKSRRLIAESILWLGSYQARAEPDAIFQRGLYSRELVWGKKVLAVGTASTGIMGAIKESGLLDDANYKVLEKVAYSFNFETKGAKT